MTIGNRTGLALLLLMIAAFGTAARGQTLRIDQNALLPSDDEHIAGGEIDDAQERTPGAAVAIGMGARPDIVIREIRFIGPGVPRNVADAAGAFVGATASADNLQALADAMSRAFKRSDVALFTLAIPEQDLSEGIVKVAVAEGHVSDVLLSGDTDGGSTPMVAKILERLPRTRPLDRATFERALSLVEDLPGLEAQTGLKLTGRPGAVRLLADLDQSRPTLGFGFTSRTGRFVKDGIIDATARGTSLLRAGDETRLNAATSIDFEALRYLALHHSTPIGADGLRVAADIANIRTRPEGLPLTGSAWNAKLSASYPLVRGFRRNVTLSGGIDFLDSRNALFGSTIAAERTTTLRAAALARLSEKKTSAALRLAIAKGVDLFDARVTAGVGEADFTAIDAGLEASQLLGQALILRAAAVGRWTRDKLPAAQRFSVGGAQFGRAFDDSLLNGDRGYAGFVETALRPVQKGDFRRSELYAFVDHGAIELLPRPGFAGADLDLGSWGGGARLSWTEQATIGVEAARAYDTPLPSMDEEWRVALNWRLKLRP